MTDNIFTLVQPDKEEVSKGYIRITWDNKESEVIQADSFGAYESIPGMVVAWRDVPEEVVGFYNSAFIRSIEIVKDYVQEVKRMATIEEINDIS